MESSWGAPQNAQEQARDASKDANEHAHERAARVLGSPTISIGLG